MMSGKWLHAAIVGLVVGTGYGWFRMRGSKQGA